MAADGSEMEYAFLGTTGLRVSRVCLGTMTFGNPLDEKASHEILDRFVELGGNFIDTADIYAGGTSEKHIGTWLSSKGPEFRRKLILASKVRMPTDPSNTNSLGLSRGHIMDGVEACLERLQCSHLDILYMHVWDDGTDVEETMSAFGDLVRRDKIRYLGLSNVTGWQLQRLVEVAKKYSVPIAGVQIQYSLLCRGPVEWELVRACAYNKLAILPWSPLKGGWLTGKVRRGTEAPEGSRIQIAEQTGRKLQSHPGMELATDHVFDLIDAMDDIAKETGATIPQVALRWLMEQPTVPSVIIGAKTVPQLEDNAGAALGKCKLSKEQVDVLTTRSEVPKPYPYEMIFRINASRELK